MTPTTNELTLADSICERIYGLIMKTFGGACKINRVVFIGAIQNVVLDEVMRIGRQTTTEEDEDIAIA
jgi:hypothetical protein